VEIKSLISATMLLSESHTADKHFMDKKDGG